MTSFIETINEADRNVRLFLLSHITFLELTERLTNLGASAVDERGFVIFGLRLRYKETPYVF